MPIRHTPITLTTGLSDLVPPVQIAVGGHQVLASGSVLCAPGEHATFTIEPLVITVVFVDEEGRGTAIDLNKKSGTALELRMVNFNNVLGSGLVRPHSIGTLSHHELFVHLWVHHVGDGTKLLSYTWLLGGRKHA